MTDTVAQTIIADMAAKIGLRLQFVADYLAAFGYGPLDLSRAVISEKVGEWPPRSCEYAMLNDLPLGPAEA